MITLMENINTIKATDYELRIMVKAIERGVMDNPNSFTDKDKTALHAFTDLANRSLGITK